MPLLDNSPDDLISARKWIAREHAPYAAKTMWAKFMGVTPFVIHHPEDLGELEACISLLNAVPYWKDCMWHLSDLSPEWRDLVAAWKTMTISRADYEMLFDIVGNAGKKTGSGRTEASMKRLLQRSFPADKPDWSETYAREAPKSLDARIDGWVVGGDTGSSSHAIWQCMVDAPEKQAYCPYDPADLGRCLRLLELVPEWKPELHLLQSVSPQWKALVDNWKELHEMMEDESGIDWSKSKSAPKTYERMKEIIG